ncbi:DUF6468 domain-containing protein [Roseibacterium beibuensis]|uniref:DUF6468 domain-containing protein n=1 Tax=[Roseibacterium] beibuensis TaxID=1193142 RepID=UPI00217E3ECF|nr:DUF6468 domain-containing protein [Roseibacterium beibuensis]MCS6627607.1 DUF6468 domain-containing protein [Roseibacterium beibuensis]
MTGMILDGVLMLLLVAALGYGVRLERKLTALREGQQAFASAVTDLNAAAGRAEAALASLRASGQETDLLHDRIIKAREVKAQLEALIARGPAPAPRAVEPAPGAPAARAPAPASTPAPASLDDERAARMAALAERIQGMAAPSKARAPGGNNVAAILGAMTANQTAKQSLNRARRSLDEDLFAA